MTNFLCFQHHDNLWYVPIITNFICLLSQSFIYIKKLSSKNYTKFVIYYYRVVQL